MPTGQQELHPLASEWQTSMALWLTLRLAAGVQVCSFFHDHNGTFSLSTQDNPTWKVNTEDIWTLKHKAT